MMAQALLFLLLSQFKQSGAGYRLGCLGVSVPFVPCEPCMLNSEPVKVTVQPVSATVWVKACQKVKVTDGNPD